MSGRDSWDVQSRKPTKGRMKSMLPSVSVRVEEKTFAVFVKADDDCVKITSGEV